MDPLTAAVRRMPDPIRVRLQGTAFQTAFARWRKHTVPLTTITAATPVGPVRMDAPEHSIIVKIIEQDGKYEPVLTEAICNQMDEKTVFYDIGARYGYYSTTARRCGLSESRIHSFEPDIVNHHILRRNLEHDGYYANKTQVGSVIKDDQMTIDAYVASNSPPTVVKIDTEGAEYDILRGMKRCLQHYQPDVFIEMHPHRLPKWTTPTEVFELLHEYGYRLRVDTDHRNGPADWMPISAADLPESRTYLAHASPNSIDD